MPLELDAIRILYGRLGSKATETRCPLSRPVFPITDISRGRSHVSYGPIADLHFLDWRASFFPGNHYFAGISFCS